MIRLTGTPIVFDIVWRPIARAVLGVSAVVVTVVLAWLGAWSWVPVPALAAMVSYTAAFWWRGDRPVQLTISHDHVAVVDSRARRTVDLPLRDIHAATVIVRDSAVPHRMEAVLVLADAHRVRLAVRLLVEPSFALERSDVRGEAMDTLLGGTGGLRGLASAEATCRQLIDDPAAQMIGTLREQLDPAVWSRTSVRVWAGAAPALDPFGVHVGEPDGLLTLDGDSWSLTTEQGTRRGTVTLVRSDRAERSVSLARPGRWNDADPAAQVAHDEVVLPLLLLELDAALVVAVPSPGASTTGTLREPEPNWLHTHVPEGGAMVWHILTRWPEIAWPAALRQRAAEALADVDPPRPSPRHRSRSTSRPT